MNQNKIKGIYAFSGDPITYGHIDVIKRAAKLVNELVVGIGVNPSKKYSFDLAERIEMAEESLKEIENVKVRAFSGLLVDYAYENDIQVIVRGIRNAEDFHYEQELYMAGESQKRGVEVIPMFARPELSHVSSSTVKALQKEQGIINEYVPLFVKQKLEEKISGQYVIGVTGTLGTGKSYVSDRLVELGKQNNVPVHNIDLDKIGHEILGSSKEPLYVKVRETLVRKFGSEILNEDESINRKVLGEKVFNNEENMEFLNNVMMKPIEEKTRREMYGKKGIMLINGALIAEANMLDVCNNNVLLIEADTEAQIKRLEKRGLNAEQIDVRIKSQYSTDEKKDVINKKIKESNYGRLWELDTTLEKQQDIEDKFFEIARDLGYKMQEEISESKIEEILKQLNNTKDEKLAKIITENIEETYNAKDRHYHNLNHILSGLEELETFKDKLPKEKLTEIQFAYLFHDYIYNTKRKDNEERSVDIAKYIAKELGQDETFLQNIEDLIMATKHHTPKNEEEEIMVDVDLAILGQDTSVFKTYEENIRIEYSDVSEEDYKEGRKKVISDFYDREAIYSTEKLREKYEMKAKLNLGLSLIELSDSGINL